jgi:hypothetical protein
VVVVVVAVAGAISDDELKTSLHEVDRPKKELASKLVVI